MICHKTKTIFIHIPKNAGSSIEQELLKVNNVFIEFIEPTKENIWNPKNHSNREKFLGASKKNIKLQHATALQSRELFEEYWEEYTTFSIVRNPYDRFVSMWYWMTQVQGEKFKGTKKEFFNNLSKINPTLAQPQVNYLFDNNNNLLVDRIFYYENLPEVFNFIQDLVPKKEIKMSHLKRSKRPTYTKWFETQKKLMEDVSNYYEDDFILLGYEK
jgi:hypothetical protein